MTRQVTGKAVEHVSALELHDAVLEAFRLDIKNNSLILSAQAYLDTGSNTRTKIEIEFVGLHDLSCVLDLASLTTNMGAGNINYWAPSKGEGKTFVYLNDGCIVISARDVHVQLST